METQRRDAGLQTVRVTAAGLCHSEQQARDVDVLQIGALMNDIRSKTANVKVKN